jgi:uncharacterized protein DUF4062
MPEQTHLIRVFLASPGDVQSERALARKVIDETNRTIAPRLGVRIELVGWETHSFPSFGSDPQALVNEQIAEMASYDLFVGILWNRMGTETPRANSGTEEEFRAAATSLRSQGRPQIMLYFNQALANLTRIDEIDQKRKVILFKDEVRSSALTWDYPGSQEFEGTFREQFQRWLLARMHATPVPPEPKAEPIREGVKDSEVKAPPGIAGEWLLLKDRFLLAASIAEDQDGTIEVRLEEPNMEDEAMLRSLQGREQWRHDTVPFAYANHGGFAKVKGAQRKSAAGRVEWIIELQAEQIRRPNVMSEMSFNDISADQIAVMRARLLLLNEPPAGASDALNNSVLHSFVAGIDTPFQVTKGIFPELWERFSGDRELFLQIARLWAVFNLKASMTVEHILELGLGPIHSDKMAVRFRGQRHQIFTNKPGQIIEVAGSSPLVL